MTDTPSTSPSTGSTGSSSGDRSARELDVVVHGATGFAGALVARYLAEHGPHGLRVALSGRSEARLHEVRAGLGEVAAGWPVLVADSHDDLALADLAARTRVVASTVGPYERHGLPLVRACAEAGTDYVDLTGEVLFMRASIEAHHATAQRSGARIVHACGFDSVPSDLGVLLLARTAARHGLGGLTDTRYVLTGGRGGVGGGTIESMRGQVDRMVGDPAARAVVADPYALSPDRAAEPDRSSARESTLGPDEDPAAGGRGRRRRGLSWDAEAGRWLAPFVMGPVNTRVVRRSNALSGWSYGRGFRYHEHVGVPGRLLGALGAGALTAGTGALALGMAVPPTRWLMDRVLPAVGTGPDEASREAGYFSVRLYARTTSGQTVQVRVRSQGDPAYVSTARMLAESALALALDRDRLPDRAGVLTPATAMGDVLVGRLREAGMTLRAL